MRTSLEVCQHAVYFSHNITQPFIWLSVHPKKGRTPRVMCQRVKRQNKKYRFSVAAAACNEVVQWYVYRATLGEAPEAVGSQGGRRQQHDCAQLASPSGTSSSRRRFRCERFTPSTLPSQSFLYTAREGSFTYGFQAGVFSETVTGGRGSYKK